MTTVPTRLHMSWGRHQVWKGIDLTAGDDATVIWWDANATGPDEVGNIGAGLYRYADGGARYLPDGWPSTAVGLYNDATSTTVLTTIPATAAGSVPAMRRSIPAGSLASRPWRRPRNTNPTSSSAAMFRTAA